MGIDVAIHQTPAVKIRRPDLVLPGRQLEWLADYFAFYSDGGIDEASLGHKALQRAVSCRSRMYAYYGREAFVELADPSAFDTLGTLISQVPLDYYFKLLFRDQCKYYLSQRRRTVPPFGHFFCAAYQDSQYHQHVAKILYKPANGK